MPTNKPRVTITISENQLKQVEDFRFDKKMRNQTQAILSLVEAGLEVLTSDGDKKTALPPESCNELLKLCEHLKPEQIRDLEGYARIMVMDNKAAEAAKQIKSSTA